MHKYDEFHGITVLWSKLCSYLSTMRKQLRQSSTVKINLMLRLCYIYIYKTITFCKFL